MSNIIRKSLALMTALSLASLIACSDKKEENSASGSSSSFSESSIAEGEFVTDPSEPDLGAYTVNENGRKLYYDPEQYDISLVEALEDYFVTFSENDFDTYLSMAQSDYSEKMEAYLQKDYGYGMQTSFEKQCENLRSNAGGEFKVTRIKVEAPSENGIESYLKELGEIFEDDTFYDTVVANTDKLHDVMFYIMAEANGEETLLISEFEIIFAEKDGKYYMFG